jgi:hypothetical protein
VLIFCRAAHFDKVKTWMNGRIRNPDAVTIWNIDEEQVLTAINHPIRKETTDIILCYPDILFDQMLLLMDRMTEKTIIYHICHLEHGLFISPNY